VFLNWLNGKMGYGAVVKTISRGKGGGGPKGPDDGGGVVDIRLLVKTVVI